MSERHALGGSRVVLCVAAKRPHKNQELLIRALPSAAEDDVVLVLAGHPEPYEQLLRGLARSPAWRRACGSRLRGGRRARGALEAGRLLRVPHAGRGIWVAGSRSDAASVPVACSDIPVLREVCGDAVLYFDPHDPGSAARAILAALDDDSLRARGREHASRYSWRDAAQGTFEAYERALRSRA